MPEQQLNFSKIFPRLQEVSRPTVPHAVRRYLFSDTGALGGVSNDAVNRFRGERLVDAPVVVQKVVPTDVMGRAAIPAGLCEALL